MILSRESLKNLQKTAEKDFKGQTINCENLYEWINIHSYLSYETSLIVLIQIGEELWKDLQEFVLDKDYVFKDQTFTDYLNGLIATYLEWYIYNNCSKWDATWDEEDLGLPINQDYENN